VAAGIHIAEHPVVPIAQPSNSGSMWVNTTTNYDCAIGGIPFFYGSTKETPYKRETAQYKKQQTDMQKEPGEQTITGWWLRSQSSFHYGAGVRYQEPIMGETVQYRFHKSAGVEVFNTGRVTLLPNVALLKATTNSPIIIGAVDSGTDIIFFADGANLWRSDGTTTTTVTWGGAGNILDLVQDGKYYYAASTTAIYRGTLAGGVGASIFAYPATAAVVKLGYAKQRIIAGVDNSIYEVVPVSSFTATAARLDAYNTATIKTSVAHNFQVGNQVTVASIAAPYNGTWTVTAVTTTEVSMAIVNAAVVQTTGLAGTIVLTSNTNLPIYTHPSSTWIWTGVADGPNAIYVSGYAGISSTIFRLALDNTGSVPLLNRALTAAELPYGEQVTAIGSYLGKYLIIGTNKGIRVGQIDTSGWLSSGYITYGPLTVVTKGFDPVTATTLNGSAVTGIAFKDRFAYCTVTNYIDNGDGTFCSGLIKIDLSKEIVAGQNQFAYATNLRLSTSTATCASVAVLGNSNTLVFGLNGAGVYQQTTVLVTSGYLQIGQIRYFTLENKHFELLKLRMLPGAKGSLLTSLVSANQSVTNIITTTDAFDYNQDIQAIDNLDTAPQQSIGLRFTISSSSNQAVNTEDVFTGYQLKAVPAVKRQRLISLPLMNFDYIKDRYNVETGYEGSANINMLALEAAESDGDVLLFQDFTTGEQVRCLIETQAYTRNTPPNHRFSGDGGILYCTIRTVS